MIRALAADKLDAARRTVDYASIRQLNDKSPEAEAVYQAAYVAYRAAFDAFMASEPDKDHA